jgi:hypothetical protein
MGILREWVESHLDALTFRDDERARMRLEIALTLALHLAGLAALWRLQQQPIWFALPTLGLLLALPTLVAVRTRRALAVESLAPFLFLYAIIIARFVFIRVLGGDVLGYFDYNAPDLRSSLFRLELWLVCSFIYTFAIQVRYFFLSFREHIPPRGMFTLSKLVMSNGVRHLTRTRLLAALEVTKPSFWVAEREIPFSARGIFRCARIDIAAFALMLVTFIWASALYLGHRTHGVTGTDPYAYAQMGVDLALHGTPLHHFTLFESVAPLNIAWAPVVHLGYHIPINSQGDAPTVWPIGGSFAFALAYRLIGEQGLYLVNPLTSLLLLVVTGWLAWELVRDSQDRIWIAALGIVLLATSHTLFDWATVPMVDAQAALFSVLAIGWAMQFARQPRLAWAVGSGLALGAAYFVRHTQLLTVPAICVLLWLNRAPRGLRVRALVAAGLASLVAALPDLWYHQVIFGGWLIPESRELSLFSIAALAETASSLNAAWLAAREFGWLLPFLLYGAYRLARDRRVEFAAFALWVLLLVGFHLYYPALRLRDLLPEFPPLVILVAYGIVAIVRALWSDTRNWRKLAAAAGFIAILFLLVSRVWNVLPIPFGAPQYAYGYMTAGQRAAFEQLSALTPLRAVIGSSSNSGAIDLYARRATFRPGDWNSAERAIFVDAMLRAQRRVFLLDDGAETSDTRRDLSARYALQQILVLDVPVFSIVDGIPGTLWEIMGTDDR